MNFKEDAWKRPRFVNLSKTSHPTRISRTALLFSFSFLLATSLSAQLATAQGSLLRIHAGMAAATSSSANLPDAPVAQQASASAPQQMPESEQQEHARAARELQQEEKQRILGLMPTFNVSMKQNAAPLSPAQKFQLFLKSSTDPWIFFLTGADAGISQAEDSFPGYGQGVEGYAKNFGASYADTFDGNFWGNAVLPVLLHEDPRYFRKGTGSFFSRFAYSASTTVWAKRDNGSWGPNYANVGGNIIGGAISNIYYPAADRGLELTFERAWTVTAEGIIGAELAEFWPDIAQHYRRGHAAKLARKAARRQQQQQQQAQPAPPQT
jgi:hypothetical protein